MKDGKGEELVHGVAPPYESSLGASPYRPTCACAALLLMTTGGA